MLYMFPCHSHAACLCFWTLTFFKLCVANIVHGLLGHLFSLLFKAIIGMFFQDGLTGSAWGDWSLYTASPLRAAAEESEDEPPKPPPFDPSKQVLPSVSVE